MSVQRYDLSKCIGCKGCVAVCPMDVFRFDRDANRSVLAYPENCQSCGQCFLHCQGRSLVIAYASTGYAISNYRAASIVTSDQVDEYIRAQPEKSAAEAEAAKEGSGTGSGSSWSGK